MCNWIYQNKVIENISQLPEGTHAFIYKVTRNSDGKFYVGKKNMYFERSKPLTKKELEEHVGKGKKPKKKKVITESDWKSYYGSEPTLKLDVKNMGESAFSREILHICTHKKQATYQELRYQILNGCLESDNCYNSQILGKIWRKDI